jgi:hypothetical protein
MFQKSYTPHIRWLDLDMPSKSIQELKSMVGKSRVTVEDFTVESGKVEEFARASRIADPVHRSLEEAQQAGFENIPAPLTFTRIKKLPQFCPPELEGETRRGFDVGFDRKHSVHGEQEYYYERPLYVGETLTGTTTLVDAFQKEGRRGGKMTFVILETEYRTDDAELVLTDRLTRIETSGPEAEATEAAEGDQ